MRRRILLLGLSVVCFPGVFRAQTANTPIERLRTEIRSLTATDCDPATSASVRELTQRMLARRREQLSLLLEERVAELKDYAQRSSVALTAEDQRDLSALLEPLKDELHVLADAPAHSCGNASAFTIPGTEGRGDAVPTDPPSASSATLAVNPKVPPAPQPHEQKPSTTQAASPADSKEQATPSGSDTAQNTPAASAGMPAKTTDGNKSDDKKTPDFQNLFLRAVAGVDLSAASSLPTQQKVFLELNVLAPFPFFRGLNNTPSVPDTMSRRVWVWLNPRFTSLPQQTATLLQNIQSSDASFNSLAQTNFNQVVQGIEVLAGAEFILNRPNHTIRFGNIDQGLSTSVYVSGGFITPLSATSNNAVEFNLPSTLTPSQLCQVFGGTFANNMCPVMTPTVCSGSNTPSNTMPPCTNVVAFVPADRTRFFYQYYTGIRVKTFFFRNASSNSAIQKRCEGVEKSDDICPIFPGIFEVGVGQNAAVSAGRLRGLILRAEGFYPLPFRPELHLFVTSWIHTGGHNVETTPVILDNTSPTVDLTAPGVFTVAVHAPNRDYYRLGMGVDLISLVKTLTDNKKKQDQTKQQTDKLQSDNKKLQGDNQDLKDRNTKLIGKIPQQPQ